MAPPYSLPDDADEPLFPPTPPGRDVTLGRDCYVSSKRATHVAATAESARDDGRVAGAASAGARTRCWLGRRAGDSDP